MLRTLPLLVVSLIAAAGSAPGVEPPRDAVPSIVLDGRFDDWRTAPAPAFATGEYVYFRLALSEAFTLQSDARTTRLLLDVDGKSTTGRADGAGDASLGVDVEILLSPPANPTAKKPSRAGLEIRRYDDAGLYSKVPHSELGFAFAPTFASEHYEFRIARNARLDEPAGSRYRSSTLLRARWRIESGPSVTFESPILDVALPPRTEIAADAALPPREDGAVRVLSWNVEWEAPEKNPAAFRRLLAAIDPDVLHLQEWRIDEQGLEAWFSANLPSPTPWRAHTYKDLGVSIVTRLPMTPLTERRLMPEREVDGKTGQPIRFVAARIESPIGPLLAGSMHLKCCGGKDTYEDRLRIAQCEAIRNFVRGALAADDRLLPVLSGDMNLVGTFEPLATLGAGLDGDGSDLAPADAATLGAEAVYTWSEADSPFSPGRLDYLLHPDARTTVAAAFVLDAGLLSAAERSKHGLEEADARASDHLPLVVDLKAKPAEPAVRALIPRTGAELQALFTDGAAEVTIVNLWATTCIPCVKELPDLLRMANERKDRVRVVLVSVDSKDDAAKAASLLHRLGVDFDSYLKIGSDQEFIDAIDPSWEGTLPVTLVFDRDGKKTLMHQGQASYEEFVEFADARASDPH